MTIIKLYQISSLEKVFLNELPTVKEYNHATSLKNEEFSYQIAYTLIGNDEEGIKAKIKVNSKLADFITIRTVENVPSQLAAYKSKFGGSDDDYLRKKSGLFPDPLFPLVNNEVDVIPNLYKSIWVSIRIENDIEAGIYPIKIQFENESLSLYEEAVFNIEILNACLIPQNLKFTQWVHADCIASYYNIEVFSDKHWELMDKFIKTAVDNGINMILTPIFTPPIDTEVGGERLTVQLVDIELKDGVFGFCFDKLKKWIEICKKNKVMYYEMPHFFTQWGAKFTPKIVVKIQGKEEKLFGWHVKAESHEYKGFLNQFIPKLLDFLQKEEILKNTYFHISDEPSIKNFESYSKAFSIVSPLLKGCNIIDALAYYEYYEKGLVKIPIVAINHIDKFINKGVKELWAYNCCAQPVNVSNRFMAMPGYRNRIIATALFKYDIKGFLHWGYNFYYSRHSKQLIDPFVTTDALNAYPSGDPFSVYPGENEPIESSRLKVFSEALQDLRAFEQLASYIGKDKVLKIIEEGLNSPITFKEYPKSVDYVLNLRKKINSEIAKVISEGNINAACI